MILSGDSYRPERDIDDGFLHCVASWLASSGEVLVVLRYLRAAGSKDFALCRSSAEFEQLLTWSPIGTDIEVFRNPQLPIRGIATEEFIANALLSIREGDEYLLVSAERELQSCICRVARMGDSHTALRDDFADLAGVEVALGVCPNFVVDDHEGLISRSKGGIDGPR